MLRRSSRWRLSCLCESKVGLHCFAILHWTLNHSAFSVQMISGSLSHENTGNQFGHFASIITFFFLGVTAISQILCLNRGLIVYDSTLVVPVFYGVYTASGCVFKFCIVGFDSDHSVDGLIVLSSMTKWMLISLGLYS